ncbi:hypothetical protein INT80_09655 [Gallibacterium anatis]|uniref:Uncharacterized protein n=1 Tax=Gallibacterium anatis TaxID=750 RepID=A0A930UU50_9PAST|nr:hypothetical protein [Gallibacterium anatis]
MQNIKTRAENVYLVNTDKISKKTACLIEPYAVGVEINSRASISEKTKLLFSVQVLLD